MRLIKFDPSAPIPSSNSPDLEQMFADRYPDMFERVYCGFALPPGWACIVDALCQALVMNGFDGKVSQVKEKFGTLCFYVDGGTEEHWKIIGRYEAMTAHTCEECGTQSSDIKPEGPGWITTLCEAHRLEHKARMQAFDKDIGK